ncbi:endonuclease domain-containing protein [Nocardia mangyaensis]|uniref:endonuclease domain-containing protein n=1 Tax=Nocardia mangyaensis TaxID=2213200 RepID=UPI002674B7EB|nr:endonuclease domain-containing protein [Nocardia mangyaensis]MDO3651295.1 endonuclease domain-containing protein [Nocardia mangyaensis]
MAGKKCNDCCEFLSLNEFHNNKRNNDGKSNKCRNCTRIRERRHVEKSKPVSEKLCKGCNRILSSAMYHKNAGKRSGLCEKCKDCRNTEIVEKRYNLKKGKLAILKHRANNACEICKESVELLAVDHCHTTNKVRGLLCSNCNNGLGRFKDNTEYLNNAINYLQESKKMKFNHAMLLADMYKISHRVQYPEGTEYVYSNWTPRSNKHLPMIKEVVCVGIQGFVKEYLIDYFDEHFFGRNKEEIASEYRRFLKHTLFIEEPDSSHIEELHDLGYLPIEIKALDEGTLVPFRVPMITIENTNPKFIWLTNYFETLISSYLWKPMTTASIAKVYREMLDKYALETTGSTEGVEFQGHDFSMRGQSGLHDAARSGFGHLLFFQGTDTIPAIQYAEFHYNANIETELVGCSVPATEHSIQCSYGKENERETYRRLIQDLYPSGIVSIVSDTWDLWEVLTDIVPSLKEEILARKGAPINKVVVRTDSGDPADILCGTLSSIKTFTKEKCPDKKTFLEYAQDYMECKLKSETPHGEHGGDLTCDVVYDGKIYNLTYSPDWNRYDKQYYLIDNY